MMKPLFALSLLSLFSCSCTGCNRLPDVPPVSYEYTLSAMRYHHLHWYRVETMEDGAVRLLVQHGNSDVLIVRAPDDIFLRIHKLVRKYGLIRLKSDYRTSRKILDGKSWHVSINYPDTDTIYSRGYHAWPGRRLWSGIEAINRMLQDIADTAKDEDILGSVKERDLDK